MPNRLLFNKSSSTFEQINQLTDEQVESLVLALERIRVSPVEDGLNIIAVDMPPVVINHFRNDKWRIAFNNSYYQEQDEYEIRIMAIDPM